MDKCIKWYKRISLLSLFLFMFGILLINICIIGLSLGSNNIAYASTLSLGGNTNGYTRDNVIGNDGILDDIPSYTTTMQANKWFCSVSSGFTISNYESDYVDGGLLLSSTVNCYFLYMMPHSTYTNTRYTISTFSISYTGSPKLTSYNFSSLNQYSDLGTINYTGRVFYFESQFQTTGSDLVGVGFYLPANSSLVTSFLKVELGVGFSGLPDDSYLPNGYYQGFTDGVNSAGGGTITGVNDLTGLTWEVPDSVTEQLSVSSVDYSVIGYAVRVDGDNSYTYNFTSLQLTNDLTFTNLVSAIFYKATGFSRAANTGDLIYFTGGTDVTNTDLIQWLEDNNTFKTYTEGYQDGYNTGHDIGYQEGYDKAMSLVNNFSSIYNIIGGFIYNTNFGSTVTDDLSGEGIQVTVPEDYGYGYGYDSISGTIGYSSGHINIYTTSLKPAYLLASNLNPYSTYFYLYDPTDLSSNINTSQLYINICPSGSSQSVRLLPLKNDLIINNCYAMNLSRLYGGNYDVYICMQVVGSTLHLSLSNTWNTGVGIGGLYQHLGDEGSYSLGYTEGYSSGYDYGMDLGYDIGYRVGQDDTNPYSFYDLFGAIYDVPVRTFNGLFDLNILGVNLKGFILGLISLCIVLFILKIVFK